MSVADLFYRDYLATCTPQERSAERAYRNALSNLENTNNEVIIPDPVVEEIGLDNMLMLRERFSRAQGMAIRAVRDPDISSIRLIPIPTRQLPVDPELHARISIEVHTAVSQGDAEMPASQPRIPRPPNCFILYRQHHHKATAAENPGVPNTDLSRIIADKWSRETPEVRAEYKAFADHLAREHAIAHPNYQYSPRRPDQVRRRRARLRASDLAFLGATTQGAQHLANATDNQGLLDIDSSLLGLFDQHGMIFGPQSVAPRPVNEPGEDKKFSRLIQEQVDRTPLLDGRFTPLVGDEFPPGFDMHRLVNM